TLLMCSALCIVIWSLFIYILFSFLLTRPPPTSTLFPYTTLFRSLRPGGHQRHLRQTHDRDARASSRPRGGRGGERRGLRRHIQLDRKSTRLNSSHVKISYAVFCLKKKKRMKLNMK